MIQLWSNYISFKINHYIPVILQTSTVWRLKVLLYRFSAANGLVNEALCCHPAAMYRVEFEIERIMRAVWGWSNGRVAERAHGRSHHDTRHEGRVDCEPACLMARDILGGHCPGSCWFLLTPWQRQQLYFLVFKLGGTRDIPIMQFNNTM